MNRILKDENSEILNQKLSYISGNSNNNSRISNQLFKEQKGFCAYTQEYLGRADAKDIEHFDPNLKGDKKDSYENWFLVKHQWNNEKSKKWFEPILYPTDESFENRIVYNGGDYHVKDSSDLEAVNLIKLINLDDVELADERKRYIKRKRDEIRAYGTSAEEFFKTLIEADIKQISYLRAIDEEFQMKVWNILP